MKDASFDFNMPSGAYREKLDDQQRAAYDAIRKEADEAARKEREDYAQNRDVYVRDEQERLTRHYNPNHDMPPPPGSTSRVPSREEIRQLAIDRVHQGHEKRLKDIADNALKREQDFIRDKVRRDFERAGRGPER